MQYFGFDRPSFGFKTYGFSTSAVNPDAAILALFAGGKQGVWYDPSDKSTLFQDVAGTVPVTKDGDPVALMRDKSGNGNHSKQSVSTARPVYKTDGVLSWLARDGVDDHFRVDLFASVMQQPFTSIFADKLEHTVTAYRFIFDSTESNRCYLLRTQSKDNVWVNAGASRFDDLVGHPDGKAEVSTTLFHGENSKFKRDMGTEQSFVLGTTGMQGLTLFARASNGLDTTKGRFYGCVIVSGVQHNNADVHNYLAAKSGVTL